LAKKLGRREFLKGMALAGVAAAGASALAGCRGDTSTSALPEKWDEEADVVVVGFGIAGACAALGAAEKGANVILIEESSMPAGNTIFSGGVITGAEDRFRKKAGVKVTKAQFLEMMMEKSQFKGSEELSKAYAEGYPELIDWLVDVVGIRDWIINPQKPFPLQLQYQGAGGGLMKALKNAVEKQGIKVLYNTRFISTIRDEMLNVVGITALTKEGTRHFKAKGGVVLTCGGIQGNKGMMCKYMEPWVQEMPVRGSVTCDGEAIREAERIGAQLLYMNQYHAGPIDPKTGWNPAIIMPSFTGAGICVNTAGERFLDEVFTYVLVAKKTAELTPDNRGYIIYDGITIERAKVKTVGEPWGIECAVEAGVKVAKGDSIEKLAEEMDYWGRKVPSHSLKQTLETFNEAVKSGRATKIEPPYSLKDPQPLETPPFYAIPYAGGFTTSFGGIAIDTKGRAIDVDDQPIPGLYAAGDASGGIFYWDYVGGTQLGTAAFFGRAAGRDAAERAKRV